MNLHHYPKNQKFYTRDGNIVTISLNPDKKNYKEGWEFIVHRNVVDEATGNPVERTYTVLQNGHWGKCCESDGMDIVKPVPTPLKPLQHQSEEELAIISIIL